MIQKVALRYYFDHYQLGKKLADITLDEFQQLEKKILEERFFASRNDENICQISLKLDMKSFAVNLLLGERTIQMALEQ